MNALSMGPEVNLALAAGITAGFTVIAALAAVTAIAVIGTLRLCRKAARS